MTTLKNESQDLGWIGFDLDGTLAEYNPIRPINEIGPPIPRMVSRLRRYLGGKYKIKIFTARAEFPGQVTLVKKWLKKYHLPDLEVTNIKDMNMIKLYDDRAVAVEFNTGKIKS